MQLKVFAGSVQQMQKSIDDFVLAYTLVPNKEEVLPQ
jgi:hypothetical protein